MGALIFLTQNRGQLIINLHGLYILIIHSTLLNLVSTAFIENIRQNWYNLKAYNSASLLNENIM